MVEKASEPNFKNIDLSNPWGELTYEESGSPVSDDVATLWGRQLSGRKLNEAKVDLASKDRLILRDENSKLIALHTFKAIMTQRHFDNFKGFFLGDTVTDPNYIKKGIGTFLVNKAIEFYDEQDPAVPISCTIGTDAGAKVVAHIKAQIGDRLQVFDSR